MTNTKQNCWHIQYKHDGEWKTESSMPLTLCRKINGNPVNPHGVSPDLEFCINEARCAMIVNYKRKFMTTKNITEWRYIDGHCDVLGRSWQGETWAFEFDHVTINGADEA